MRPSHGGNPMAGYFKSLAKDPKQLIYFLNQLCWAEHGHVEELVAAIKRFVHLYDVAEYFTRSAIEEAKHVSLLASSITDLGGTLDAQVKSTYTEVLRGRKELQGVDLNSLLHNLCFHHVVEARGLRLRGDLIQALEGNAIAKKLFEQLRADEIRHLARRDQLLEQIAADGHRALVESTLKRWQWYEKQTAAYLWSPSAFIG